MWSPGLPVRYRLSGISGIELLFLSCKFLLLCLFPQIEVSPLNIFSRQPKHIKLCQLRALETRNRKKGASLSWLRCAHQQAPECVVVSSTSSLSVPQRPPWAVAQWSDSSETRPHDQFALASWTADFHHGLEDRSSATYSGVALPLCLPCREP